MEVQSQSYRPCHEIIWQSHQKKADTIYSDFPSNVQTIAGSLRVFSYSSIFAVFLEMPTPFGISRKASGLLVCVCKSALLHQRGIFLAGVRLFKATAARMEEGRALYLGHAGVNTE